MKILSTLLNRGMKVHIIILCLLCLPSTVLAIEPIATIGQPRPIQHAFLNNDTIIRVVPTQIHIVDANTHQVVDEFGKCTDFSDVIFSPSASHLAILNHTTNPRTTTVTIWDVNARQQISQWEIASVVYNRALFSPVQPIFATYLPFEIHLWNWKTGKSVAKIPRENYPAFRAMAFSPDGRHLFIASKQSIELWNVETERFEGNLVSQVFEDAEDMLISPNGEFLAAYERDSSYLNIWNVESRQHLWEKRSGLGRIKDMKFSPDSQNLYVATATSGIRRSGTEHWQGWDDQVRVWDVNSGEQDDIFGTEFRCLQSITLSPNEEMALLHYNDGMVLWDIREKRQHKVWADYPSWITGLSPNGKTFISLSHTHLKSWDIPLRKLNLLESSEGEYFEGFAFSSDGQKLAIGKNPWIEIRDSQTGKDDIKFSQFIGRAEAIEFSPSGGLLAVGNDFGKLFILDTNSHDTFQEIDTGENGNQICLFSKVAFSQNDDYLVATSYPANNQYSIMLWKREGETFENLYSWKESIHKTDSMVDFATTENGTTVLAVTSIDGINIWKLLPDSPELLTTINEWHEGHFSSDGPYLITHQEDQLQIWNWQSQTPHEQVNIPRLFAVSQDGSIITSFNEDGQIQIYDGTELFPSLHGVINDKLQDKKIVTFGQIKRNNLLQNYPNPFNPETWIPFRLADESNVTIDIYSSTGELVRKLVVGKLSAGDYSTQSDAVHWDGKNDIGESVSSGIYYYTINAGNFSATRKMLISK